MSKKSTNIQLLPSELLVDIIKAIKFTPSSFTNKTLHMLIKDRTEWSKYATKLMNCSSIIYTFVGNTFLEFKKMDKERAITGGKDGIPPAKRTRYDFTGCSSNIEPSEFNEIIVNQRKFFKTGDTRELSFRKEQLQKLRGMIERNGGRITEAVYKDLDLNKELIMEMDVRGSLEIIDLCLENLENWAKPEKFAINKPDELEMGYEPKGVVLVIGAWNYPSMLVIQSAALAIAAGNTVVIKPSEVTADTSHLIKVLFEETFPKDLIAVIEGAIEETKILNERFDHIFYTGSSNMGKVVILASAEYLTPVTLELNGKYPAIVEDDADLEKAAQRIIAKKWFNNGQTCLSPDYIMTTNKTKEKLLEELKKIINTMYGTNPQQSDSRSRMLNQRHFDRVFQMMEHSKGRIIHRVGDYDRASLFIPPTISEVETNDALMQEEVFGPILPILTVEDLDKAIDIINTGNKPLGAYLFTEDKEKEEKFFNNVSICSVNMAPYRSFGGARAKYLFIQLSHPIETN
ncbi:hypothetical protein ACQ4LE_000669 [Meloidogyne hapla]